MSLDRLKVGPYMHVDKQGVWEVTVHHAWLCMYGEAQDLGAQDMGEGGAKHVWGTRMQGVRELGYN